MAPPNQAALLTDSGARDGDAVDGEPRDPRDIIFQRNQRESPLLRLPAELRNKIYGYVVGGYHVRPSWETKRMVLGTTYPGWGFPRSHLALLGTCRQTFTESKLLPFTLNTFGGLPEHILDTMATFTVEQAGAIELMFLYVDVFGTYNNYKIDDGLQEWFVTTMRTLCSYINDPTSVPLSDPDASTSDASTSGVPPSTRSSSSSATSPARSSSPSTSSGLRRLGLVWYDKKQEEGLCERLRQSVLVELEDFHKRGMKVTAEYWDDWVQMT